MTGCRTFNKFLITKTFVFWPRFGNIWPTDAQKNLSKNWQLDYTSVAHQRFPITWKKSKISSEKPREKQIYQNVILNPVKTVPIVSRISFQDSKFKVQAWTLLPIRFFWTESHQFGVPVVHYKPNIFPKQFLKQFLN